MDFIKTLMADESCAVDGTASASNPLATLMNKAFEGAYDGDERMMTQMGMHGGPPGEERILVPDSGARMDPVMQSHVGADLDMQHGAMMPPSAIQAQPPVGIQMHMQQMQMQQMHMQQMHMQQMHMQMQQMQMMGMEKEHQEWAHKEMGAMRNAIHEEDDVLQNSIPRNTREGYDGAERLDSVWDTLQGKEDDGGPSKVKYREEWKKLQERLEGLDKNETQPEYIFQDSNPYAEGEFSLEGQAAGQDVDLDEDPSEEALFRKGVEMYEAGDIQEAILAFEAGVQKRPDNDECWRYLGTCHAENDEDKQAIVCLHKAIEIDPYNLGSLLALGTSYVNELDPEKALRMLQSWVTHNPRFHGLQVTPDMHSDGTLLDEVMQLVLAAHQHAPEDVDINILMGVLYNVSSDFDSASSLLSQAASSGGAPADFNLLNKLGATLANSNKSEEALPIYKQALEQRPTYARGWLNLGISLANLNRYQDAAKAYIQALHLNPRAKHIWGYLRVVLTCLEELDMVELCGKEDLPTLSTKLGLQLGTRGRQPVPDASLLAML